MSFAEQYRTKLLAALDSLDLAKVEQAVEWLAQARNEGRSIFVCGNGGSAATASHMVCDMVKGASYQREKKFRMICLNDSVPSLTAYANDVGFKCVFVEQLKNFAARGDVVIAISGSGNSPNVLLAVEYARSAGCRTIGLTGRDGGKLGGLVDLEVRVAHQHMGRIEDLHLVVVHMLCYSFMDQPET